MNECKNVVSLILIYYLQKYIQKKRINLNYGLRVVKDHFYLTVLLKKIKFHGYQAFSIKY